MPTYVYHCPRCAARFERRQRFSDPAVQRCPECHKATPKRVPQPVGIVFRGSGFYVTDSRTR